MKPVTTADMNKWGSHQPALLACILNSKGSVLEIGVGHFSTALLHAVCATLKRSLTSIDADADWIGWMKERFVSDKHEFIHGEYAEVIPRLSVPGIGVAFIDHSATTEQRVEDFDVLLKNSEFVVVHDFHADSERAIRPILENVKHWHVCELYQPPTLVASMMKAIPTVVKQL